MHLNGINSTSFFGRANVSKFKDVSIMHLSGRIHRTWCHLNPVTSGMVEYGGSM